MEERRRPAREPRRPVPTGTVPAPGSSFFHSAAAGFAVPIRHRLCCRSERDSGRLSVSVLRIRSVYLPNPLVSRPEFSGAGGGAQARRQHRARSPRVWGGLHVRRCFRGGSVS